MKQSYSNLLRKMLIAIYQPIVTRIELFRATRMWQKGVKATIAKYKECGAPRFYMLYDQSHKDFAIMTYDPNRKNMLAYRRLVQMGKWKATRYFKNVEDIKAASYYYTPSKWGAIGCDADNWTACDTTFSNDSCTGMLRIIGILNHEWHTCSVGGQ